MHSHRLLEDGARSFVGVPVTIWNTRRSHLCRGSILKHPHRPARVIASGVRRPPERTSGTGTEHTLPAARCHVDDWSATNAIVRPAANV